MLRLSDRLQAIADLVRQGEIVADIGTDHGFLPISLWKKGISPHVILSDINEGPLEKAKLNISKYCPEKAFDIRQGSGLSTLKADEADVIVIAGMGGSLIADILGSEKEKAKSCMRLILQPRNAQDKLREWLVTNGFLIVDEVLVREGRYICEIIVVEPAAENVRSHTTDDNSFHNQNLESEISPILFQKNDPLLVEFILNKIRIEKKIKNDIKNGIGTEDYQKLKDTEERIALLQALLERSGNH